MLRIKKITDSVFPRNYSNAIKSYINNSRNNFSIIRDEQISNIKKHYENQLLALKKCIKIIEYTKKAKEILDLYNKDPYLYANRKQVDYQLPSKIIKEIRNNISSKLFKSKEEKDEIETQIKNKELENIKAAFDSEFEKLNKRYPPKVNVDYKATEESLAFQKEYKNNV